MSTEEVESHNDSRMDGDESSLTLSKHLFAEWKTSLMDPSNTNVSQLQWEPIDAYISLNNGKSQGQLPALDWNHRFRKAYSLLMWIRPRLLKENTGETTTSPDKNENEEEGGGEEEEEQEDTSSKEVVVRTLYRLCTTCNNDNDGALGISVTCTDWTFQDNQFQTTLTATSLNDTRPNSCVSVPLVLDNQDWHLIGIVHTFPYLKRPLWTLTINGMPIYSAELHYPVTEQPMQDCIVLSNMVSSPIQTKTKDDNNNNKYYDWTLDWASLSLYPEAVVPALQAVACEAGVNLSLQKGGRILCTLPPMSNWSKGSSLEGPKVGIPLTVHSYALELQQVSSKLVFGTSAIQARVLGSTTNERRRIVCPLALQAGSTEGTPRVGLIQPSIPIRITPEDVPTLIWTGNNITLFHALSNTLMQAPENLQVAPECTTLNWSVAVQEQQVLHWMVLPFFLSLCPPARVYERHVTQYRLSIQYLYQLYTSQGEYAARLIQLLAQAIRHGGARVHEEVLQSGLIHILASSLRLSLLRAQRVKLLTSSNSSTLEEVMERFQRVSEDVVGGSNNHHQSRPDRIHKIPSAIVTACVELISACCGPNHKTMSELSPAMQIRRTSDLALTCLFGLALDLDLWSGDASAANIITEAAATRYGGVCLLSGYILRSQVSVQFWLDSIRLRFDNQAASFELEQAGLHMSQLLQSMLLSSLSNKRSIAQGEHDVSACMAALSDCPLGSVGAHVVLNAIVGVLTWCEILPVEAAALVSEPSKDEEQKMQVATRLGRNLLMAQFHDVIAPMVLSRTIFSGERTMAQPKASNLSQSGLLSWESHWRLALLLFSWVASIAGPEGLIAAKSTGSLLLASGLAGSLKGAFDGTNKIVISTLFLPPPAMALMIGSTIRDEWSYTDLLSDRLQIMMPFVPGIVVSILSHPSDSTADTVISHESLTVLSELLTSVGGAFHRVFGGVIHSTEGTRRQSKSRRDGSSESIKAARTFVPHLLVVAMLLENHIALRSSSKNEDGVKILRPRNSNEAIRRLDSLDSWVDVSKESVINEVVVALPSADDETNMEAVLSVLRSCQKSVVNTAAGLISNAMNLGGAGSSVSLWQTVLETLQGSVSYSIADPSDASGEQDESPPSEESEHQHEQKSAATELAQNVLCRLAAVVLIKALNRDYQWEVWSYELSSAVSRLCMLIEEKELLRKPIGSKYSESDLGVFSEDQTILLCALLDVLEYGRDTTGWCQLALPAMGSGSEGSKSGKPSSDLSAASKLLLPVLQPCFRIVIECVVQISSTSKVCVPADSSNTGEITFTEEALLGRTLAELDFSLTAAIVGLSFSNARDIALNGMATLRRAESRHRKAGDESGARLCSALLCKVADELRERYKGEKRLRDTALFDAYEDDAQDAARRASQESQEVERLILGGDVFGLDGISPKDSNDSHDEIVFDSSEKDNSEVRKKVSDDFVLFHEPSASDDLKTSKLGYAEYEGLSKALDECNIDKATSMAEAQDEVVEKVLSSLAPYLDAWDASAARDAAESELVDLFDTSMRVEASDSRSLRSKDEKAPHLPILGSETAADAMSTFFEFAAAEKSRLKELSARFFPSHRYSRMSYAERFCWARYAEASAGHADSLWERGLPDGNRDVRSRIPTVPCSPQFRRYIPKYLDHGPQDMEDEGAAESPQNFHRQSSTPGEMDAFTKTLLETGNLEIVDITKKEVEDDEDGPELSLHPKSGSLDEADDFFGESAIESETLDTSLHSEEVKPLQDETEAESTAAETGTTDESSQIEEPATNFAELVGKGSYHSITSSAFATPPDNASSSLSLMNSAAAGMIQMHLENCMHVKAEGSRQCTLLLTSTHLILEYDGSPEGFFEGELLAVQEEADRQRMIDEDRGPTDQDPDSVYQQRIERRQREVAALRPKSIRWNLSEVSHVYLRRYRLRDSSLELFFIPSGGASFGGYGVFAPASSLFLDFGPGYEGNTRRDDAAFAVMKRSPPQAIKQWPDRSAQFLHDQLSRVTMGWVEGRITNFDYLLHLNMLAGRSYNDICQYPVMPWVLSNYSSEEIPDLTDRDNFRDLTKPVGALNPGRLEEFLERFNTFADPSIPPFMYGSHYSTSAGVVLHFLVRLHPFAGLHRQLQGGHFDVADRLFSSVPRTWGMCTGPSAAEVKELTPEFYCNPAFLKNVNKFKLGTSQDGEVLGDVSLPPWAKGSPEKFVEVMRAALESDICSKMLPDWIDLIFGRKQQGIEAVKANNVFFYLTYYGSVDVASIEDESLRHATELQIAHFGMCPMQLLRRPHVRRLPRDLHRLSFFQLMSPYSQGHIATEDRLAGEDGLGGTTDDSGKAVRRKSVLPEPAFLPFFSAPMSHWVHLDAPPPGPHASLVAVRLAGTDRCFAVDAKGIFHSFRWAWRAEEPASDSDEKESSFDLGCFVAQRELPRFRSVPRLMHTPNADELPAVAISKTLFAGRTVLLVLSAGDGCGGFGMQLVDPAKGNIRGEVLIPSVHSARITCIATDPVGTAAGHGGVGGELALIASEDGNASMWRFMSSHYLPLRPRARLSGHEGSRICAVALCSTIHVALTLSVNRCCLHSVGNGNIIRSFGPPVDTLDFDASDGIVKTKFADTPALAVSVQGFIVTVCESSFESSSGSMRSVMTLNLFNLEGVSLGSKPLEGWRGLPHKMQCTPDGTAVLVCCGRGVTIHRLSAIQPLDVLDEFVITETDDLSSGQSIPTAYDIDLGPSLNRPVVAAAACSSGVLRLHALPGISAWSERHKKSGLSQTVGTALSKPARRLNRAMREGLGIGRQLAGMGREIGREVTSDVKERGVGGFLGNIMSRKNSTTSNK